MDKYHNASIGEYPILIPNYNGIFRFRDVNFPYDLTIGSVWWKHFSCVYRSLSIQNPVVTLPYEFSANSKFREILISVNFPEIEVNKIGLIKFISKDLIDTLPYEYFNNLSIYKEHTTDGAMLIRVPVEKSSVSGKVIFLEGTGYWDGNNLFMEDYDNYGSKDITVYEKMGVTFTEEEISTNPPESNVTFNVKYPSGTVQYSQVKVFLNFNGYCTNSKLLISQVYNSAGQFEVSIPVLADLNFKVKAVSSFNFIYSRRFYPLKMIELETGGNGNLEHHTLELSTPENGKTDVDENDYLSVQYDGDDGIYIFYIFTNYPYKNVCIITDKNSIRWGDLRYRDFKIERNKNYNWHVVKLTSFSSINDFTEMPYMFNADFNSVSVSDSRTFSTAP